MWHASLNIIFYNPRPDVTLRAHDDIIKWRHFPRYWSFVRWIHRPSVNSPQKGQWRRALTFSLICAWINGWVINRAAGDLRHHRAHYDVTVIHQQPWYWQFFFYLPRCWIVTLKHMTDSRFALSQWETALLVMTSLIGWYKPRIAPARVFMMTAFLSLWQLATQVAVMTTSRASSDANLA